MRQFDYWAKNGLDKPIEFIVCAACKHPTLDLMAVGARHWDVTMRTQFKSFDPSLPNMKSTAYWEQGFINQFGDFLTREESMKIAKNGGQRIDINRCGGSENTLYSEGLY